MRDSRRGKKCEEAKGGIGRSEGNELEREREKKTYFWNFDEFTA